MPAATKSNHLHMSTEAMQSVPASSVSIDMRTETTTTASMHMRSQTEGVHMPAQTQRVHVPTETQRVHVPATTTTDQDHDLLVSATQTGVQSVSSACLPVDLQQERLVVVSLERQVVLESRQHRNDHKHIVVVVRREKSCLPTTISTKQQQPYVRL